MTSHFLNSGLVVGELKKEFWLEVAYMYIMKNSFRGCHGRV